MNGRAPRRRTLEHTEQSKIIKALQERGAKIIKVHVDGYTVEGTPDLIGCYKGRAFALECKMVDEEPSLKQKIEMIEWRKAGAISCVVFTVKDALDALGIS